jgi:hypothetical protein
MTILPDDLDERLRAQVESVSLQHQRDLAAMIYTHVIQKGALGVCSPLDFEAR